MDLGIHKIDLTLHLMGFEPWTRLIGHRHDGVGRGVLEPLGLTTDIEDFAAAMGRLESGRALYVESAYYLNMPEKEVNDVEIYGDAGCIVLPKVSEAFLYRRERPGEAEPVEPRNDLGSSPVEHFTRVIQGEIELSPTAEDGLEVLGMVEAVYRSADEGGRPVERDEMLSA